MAKLTPILSSHIERGWRDENEAVYNLEGDTSPLPHFPGLADGYASIPEH
jgi:hypothetical protein